VAEVRARDLKLNGINLNARLNLTPITPPLPPLPPPPRATVLTALLYPGLFFGTFFVLNLINWANQSTDAVPFTSMCVVILLWFGVSVPLVFMGSYFGYKKDPIEFPTATSNIPRQIPEQSWFMNTGVLMVIGGILPFGALFVELFLILSSVWSEEVRREQTKLPS
jgi:transmembrane 9 superfamily protein 2/4